MFDYENYYDSQKLSCVDLLNNFLGVNEDIFILIKFYLHLY